MKKGIYTGIGYPVPIEERMKLIKAAGFDFVCLNFEKDMEWSETSWENQVRLAGKYGLPVEAVHLTGTKMTNIWTDCEDAEFVTLRLTDELRNLKALGLKIGVVHVSWGFERPAAPSENALNRFFRIAEAAEKYNVKVAFENSVFAEHLHFVIDNVKSKNIGFCYDSGHENAFTPNEDYLSAYGGRLFTMHLHDNNGDHDDHNIPFRGNIDWNKKIGQIKNSSVKDCIILEVGVQKESLPELIKMSAEAADKLMEL